MAPLGPQQPMPGKGRGLSASAASAVIQFEPQPGRVRRRAMRMIMAHLDGGLVAGGEELAVAGAAAVAGDPGQARVRPAAHRRAGR